MADARTVAAGLERIGRLMALSEKGGFKAKAYLRGAEAIQALGSELPAVIAEGRLEQVEGVGKSLRKQILELYETGEAALVSELARDLPPGAAEFVSVPALTLRRMRVLHESLGISTLTELREACDMHRVAALSGFGAKVEARIQSELAALDTAAEPSAKLLLLSDALLIAQRIALGLTKSGAAQGVELAGSARRGEETVARLALVAVSDDAPAVLQALAKLDGVVRVDHARSTAQLAEGIALDLHVASAASAGAQLFSATGSEQHLASLDARARRLGLPALSQLVQSAGTSEAAIYRALGLNTIPPELRADERAVELAAHDDFADLLSVNDVRGMVHCHTRYSDGKDSVEDMARAALALGMEYITITDHSPTASYAGGVELDRLKRQWDEIAEVESRVPIRILRGTESDILADGSLDYPDAVLERFDVVIASIHARHRMGKQEMTERLVRAMSLPLFKIWGHALGRLLLSRDPIECDVEQVFDALAGSRGAVELSCDPHRLDLPPALIPLARERKLSFVVSVDAHSTRGLQTLPLGVTMARRGGVRRSEVLNALPAAEFAARVRPT